MGSLKKWEKPFLTCFSDQDPIMKNGEKIFIKLIPGAQRQNHFITKNAGHFLQEDDGINLAKEMVNLIQSLS